MTSQPTSRRELFEETQTTTLKRKRSTKLISMLKVTTSLTVANIGLVDLPDDVLIQILAYTSLDDMDNLATLSKALYKARNHSCIDPTRTGTIMVQPWTTNLAIESLLLDLQSRKLMNSFDGHRNRLKLQGLERVDASKMSKVTSIARWAKWDHVTTLDISVNRNVHPQHRKVKNSVIKAFAMSLPNLRVLDMSYVKVTTTAVNTFSKYCPNLEVFRWKGSDEGLQITGKNLTQCHHLKEIDVEGSIFYCSIYRRESTPRFYDPKMAVFLEALQLFSDCSSTHIERVNVKGCKWYSWDVTMGCTPEDEPLATIPNETLIRFVCNTPSLRRFESSLPKYIIEKLKIQYPQITFC